MVKKERKGMVNDGKRRKGKERLMNGKERKEREARKEKLNEGRK